MFSLMSNMIDNIDIIAPLLEFREAGDFYMLYVLKRKKDMPEGERESHQSARTIKTYCVEGHDQLMRRYDEVRRLCDFFGARAYMHVQRQNHRDVSLEMMVALAERIRSGSHRQNGLFDSVVGGLRVGEKRWVVDIDVNDEEYVGRVSEFVDSLRPEGSKVIAKVPTRNGFHLITKGFDAEAFRRAYPGIDIQKRNPTLLYMPGGI